MPYYIGKDSRRLSKNSSGPSIIHLRIFVCWDPHFFWEIPPPPLSTCNSATIVSHSTQLFWYRAELMVQIWPNCFPGQDNCYKDGGREEKRKKKTYIGPNDCHPVFCLELERSGEGLIYWLIG